MLFMIYVKFILSMMSDFFEQSFLGHIPLSTCPSCQKPYAKTSGQMLMEDEETRLFHVVCSFCDQATLALVSLFEQGSQTRVLLTDAARDDIQRFCLQDAVHANFRRVNLHKPIIAEVQLQFVGESLAVRQLGGILIHVRDVVEVKALPM